MAATTDGQTDRQTDGSTPDLFPSGHITPDRQASSFFSFLRDGRMERAARSADDRQSIVMELLLPELLLLRSQQKITASVVAIHAISQSGRRWEQDQGRDGRMKGKTGRPMGPSRKTSSVVEGEKRRVMLRQQDTPMRILQPAMRRARVARCVLQSHPSVPMTDGGQIILFPDYKSSLTTRYHSNHALHGIVCGLLL